VASWFPREHRTSSYGDLFRPAPPGHLEGGVLDVPIVELLVVVVDIPDVPVVELIVDVVKIASCRGEGILGAAAAVGPIVLVAVAIGPARASRDGRKRRFVARSIARLIVVFLGVTAVGPIVCDGATLESIVVVVVVVELLLLRVKIASSGVLLGDGGGLRRPLLRAAPSDKPPVSVRSSGSPWGLPWGSSSPMGSVRPRSAVAFARSRRRRKVSSPRSFFRGDGPRGFFVGDPPAASASATPPSILAPQAGFRRVGTDPKLFETFGPLGALLPGFFSADVALANAPAAPSSPPFVRRDGLMREGVVGAMMIYFLLDLACFTEASG
jgi:hypothetical protein